MQVLILVLLALLANVSFAAGDDKALEEIVKNDNLFSSSFVESKHTNAKRIVNNDEPKLYAGKDKVADKLRMEQRGFELIGYSDFQAGDVPPEMAIPQAKKLHADTVLLYSERVNTSPASVRLQQMRDANSANNKANVSYQYFASYWVKLAKPSLGVHVKVPEVGEKVEGLEVMVVLEGSAAQAAGLMKDDILVSIGDVLLTNVEDLSKAVQQYAGQTVDMVYIRERMRHQEKLTLN
jgi:hypothetical protein